MVAREVGIPAVTSTISVTPLIHIGDLLHLVKARAGFHILKVDERRTGGAKTFDEVKEEIRDRLTNEQVDTFRNQYVADLRRDALIEVRIPELKE